MGGALSETQKINLKFNQIFSFLEVFKSCLDTVLGNWLLVIPLEQRV